MNDQRAEGWRLRLARLWCAMYGHRIRFPRDVWADLSCRRCDWTGPSLPPWPPWPPEDTSRGGGRPSSAPTSTSQPPTSLSGECYCVEGRIDLCGYCLSRLGETIPSEPLGPQRVGFPAEVDDLT